MWAMIPMFRMFSLWLMRRSISVVCLNRGIKVCFLCRGLLVCVQKKFFWCEELGIGLRVGG
jgi:hypothetical protein